jgi:hypothetical protein
MQAYEGYFEDGRFTPIGTFNIRGRRRVRVTVLDEPAQPSVSDQELRAAWLKELDAAIDLSMGEELHNVPRSAIMREPVNLTDEG